MVRNGSVTSLDKRTFLKTSLFCAQGKMECHSGLECHEGEYIFIFAVNTDNERLTVHRNTEQANILNIKLSNYAVCKNKCSIIHHGPVKEQQHSWVFYRTAVTTAIV